MLERFGKLAKILFFLGLIIFATASFLGSDSLGHFKQQSYKIECENGKNIVLQGSQPEDFWVIEYFMLEDARSEKEAKMNNLRCQYYDEYQRTNELWLAGEHRASDKAHGELYKAHYDEQSSYPTHFDLVPHEIKYDWDYFGYAILDGVIIFVLGIILYFIVKFCINFVVYDKKSL